MSDEGTPFSSVYEALCASAQRRPNKTAIVYDGAGFTYAELLDRVDNTARQLLSRGIGRSMSFAAYGYNSPDLIFCYYAAAKLGAIFVPVNPHLTPPEVKYTLHHSGSRALFYDEALAEAARLVVPDGTKVPLANLREPLDRSDNRVSSPTQPGDDFLIIYSSGSTGTPKAIVLNQAAQIEGPRALGRMWGLTDDDVTLVALPLGYLYGLSTACAAGLQAGGAVVILPRFHPGRVLEALVAQKATVYHGVPTMFSMMLEYCEQRDLTFDLSDVRQLISAGAPLPQETRKRFAARFRKELQDYYALTEATPVFGKYFDDPRPVPCGAVGQAAPGLMVKIVRPDGSECDVGEDGEILVRAAATMKRYLNAPEQTAAALQDGYFKSGDLGHRDASGFYYITGRIKDVIIRGGANISPAEVEAVLAAHPAVRDVAVVGVSDGIFGEVPFAFIVRRHGMDVSEEELIGHAEVALADFKVPRRYAFVTELPQGSTGKVDKVALRKRCEEVASEV